jgi:hypothetical protein
MTPLNDANGARRRALRKVVTAAGTLGVAPPLALFGIRAGADTGWELGPMYLGAALWITLIMVGAAWVLSRETRHTPR